MRALISSAASAQRGAMPRTSVAATTKPRPASPARAASMPALRASRLGWKAISSITPMIWLNAPAGQSRRASIQADCVADA
jgi:hypothetical protein